MEVCGRINGLGLEQQESYYVFEGEQGKRDSIIVVAQLCSKFTSQLVDCWQELEEQVRYFALYSFSVFLNSKQFANQHLFFLVMTRIIAVISLIKYDICCHY